MVVQAGMAALVLLGPAGPLDLPVGRVRQGSPATRALWAHPAHLAHQVTAECRAQKDHPAPLGLRG